MPAFFEDLWQTFFEAEGENGQIRKITFVLPSYRACIVVALIEDLHDS